MKQIIWTRYTLKKKKKKKRKKKWKKQTNKKNKQKKQTNKQNKQTQSALKGFPTNTNTMTNNSIFHILNKNKMEK